jgi:hypothetical protein
MLALMDQHQAKRREEHEAWARVFAAPSQRIANQQAREAARLGTQETALREAIERMDNRIRVLA